MGMSLIFAYFAASISWPGGRQWLAARPPAHVSISADDKHYFLVAPQCFLSQERWPRLGPRDAQDDGFGHDSSLHARISPFSADASAGADAGSMPLSSLPRQDDVELRHNVRQASMIDSMFRRAGATTPPRCKAARACLGDDDGAARQHSASLSWRHECCARCRRHAA